MKLTIFIVAACMALLAVQSASVPEDHTLADKPMMEKQRFIFEILYRVDHDLMMDEWIKMGEKLIIDKGHYMKFSDWMTKFYHAYKSGGLLPRGEFFSAMVKDHLMQAMGLFNFFYYAKDWETLVHNMAWARMNMNEGMFVYAMSMAVIHRDDMQGIIMPQIYEIFPQMFFSSKYIMAAEKFDWDSWNRQIMFEKEMKESYLKEFNSELYGNIFYEKDWSVWQWWKLMGLDDGWHMEEKSMLRDNMHFKGDDPMWMDIYGKMKMMWMPMDYSRDVKIFNEESKLSYFTEDVAWNAYWYYLNMDYAKYLDVKEFNLEKDRHGEWWLYNMQQMLARYYMERLSHGLGDIPAMPWYGTYKAGYDPQLIAYNGNGFTFRKNYWELQSYQNLELWNKLMSIDRRIDDVIASGKYVMKDGTMLDLTSPKSIEFIGDLMQGNMDIMDRTFFGYWWGLSAMFLGGADYHDFMISPNALMNYESMLRDPAAYSLFKMAVKRFYMFKDQLPAYSHKELLFEGAEIVDVKVSKLMTYFDLVDMDMSTLLNDKMMFHEGKLVREKVLMGRQMRLNHEPFAYDMHVKADKKEKVVIRAFMGPVFNEYGQKLNLMENRENYMEMDEFIYELAPGENEIHRSSEDFEWTANDPLSYTEMYNYLMESYEGKYKFHMNISEAHSLFPDRLILPYGWAKGMPMMMFFMMSPYKADYEQYASYDHSYLSGIGSGVRHIDDMPFGYPLDRKIEDLKVFMVPNMFIKHVKIYHNEKYDKYYPMKYEHFGSFDYDF